MTAVSWTVVTLHAVEVERRAQKESWEEGETDKEEVRCGQMLQLQLRMSQKKSVDAELLAVEWQRVETGNQTEEECLGHQHLPFLHHFGHWISLMER